MHSGGKGIASSALPYKRAPPTWLKQTPQQVEELICKLAKKGLTPSQVSIYEHLYFHVFIILYYHITLYH